MDSSTNGAAHLAFPEWEPEFRAAITETNPLLLGEKLHAAETAILKRLEQLKDAPAESAEREAISVAMVALERLQIKTFGHSDWQT
jgi:hypothetical protein